MWSILSFGRYKDKMSLPEVVLHDPERTCEEVCETEIGYERETKNSRRQPPIEKMNLGEEAHEGEV